ncbi:Helix-turn-helix domain-containing protein [Limimonas halophila]|uniref:Helix-turn-helix domain-containing protein n=1 Tax=Limimonas halophila TaxID=1082479 RepID=A0A1G7SK78_9PROT|nr:helix-turn-helix transcriptional regulator [Limimonas halophila]SDG23486.1 Helix-turn-helix domain-containing protein [Limimonas halophila]
MSTDAAPVSRDQYDAMVERLADLEDTVALLQARLQEDGPGIPAEVLRAELDGVHLLTAWRENLGMTARDLAARAGVSATYLSEIETGRKPGSTSAYRALSSALDVPMDYLVPDE